MTLSVETKDYKLYRKLYDELTGIYGHGHKELIIILKEKSKIIRKKSTF